MRLPYALKINLVATAKLCYDQNKKDRKEVDKMKKSKVNYMLNGVAL